MANLKLQTFPRSLFLDKKLSSFSSNFRIVWSTRRTFMQRHRVILFVPNYSMYNTNKIGYNKMQIALEFPAVPLHCTLKPFFTTYQYYYRVLDENLRVWVPNPMIFKSWYLFHDLFLRFSKIHKILPKRFGCQLACFQKVWVPCVTRV